MNLRAVSSGAVERFARYEALQQSSAASKLPDVAWKVLRPEDGIRAPASLRTPPSEACLSEQEVFRNFDLNGDGLISKEEMSYALRVRHWALIHWCPAAFVCVVGLSWHCGLCSLSDDVAQHEPSID